MQANPRPAVQPSPLGKRLICSQDKSISHTRTTIILLLSWHNEIITGLAMFAKTQTCAHTRPSPSPSTPTPHAEQNYFVFLNEIVN